MRIPCLAATPPHVRLPPPIQTFTSPLQSTLERLEREVLELHQNDERLQRAWAELSELQLLLERGGTFFQSAHALSRATVNTNVPDASAPDLNTPLLAAEALVGVGRGARMQGSGRGRRGGGGLGAARWEEWGSGEQAVGECLDWQVPSLLGTRWGWALRGPNARQANVMTGGRTPIALWQGRAVVVFSDVTRQPSAMFRHPPSQTPFPEHRPALAPHHLGTCPSGFRIRQDGAPELHRRPYPEHSQGAL